MNNTQNTTVNTSSLYSYVEIAAMAAVICILGPLSLPLPFTPVPISFTNLVIYFIVYVLGWKKSTISYFIYLLVGLAGMPVFSGFSAGPAKLLGPTGGYLIGFIAITLISGFIVEKFPSKPLIHLISFIFSTAIVYLFGSIWLAYQGGYGLMEAISLGVLPYIPGDLAKMIIACIAGPLIYKRLKKIQ